MTKLLAALHLDSPDSLKRAIVFLLSAVASLGINPLLVKENLPPISDANLLAFAGIVTGFLLQSGAKAGMQAIADAKIVGAVAAAAVVPGPAAEAVVDAMSGKVP